MKELKWNYPNSKWIYVNNATESELGTARFILGTIGSNPLICFGINPSTAWHKVPDDTLFRVEKYAHNHGFDSWIMFNIYPQRATNPNKMHLDEAFDIAIHKKNLECIESTLQNYPKARIWAAWGKLILKRKYLLRCLQDIKSVVAKYDCEWLSLLEEPCHPLYRGKGFKLYETPLKKFDIEDYVRIINKN